MNELAENKNTGRVSSFKYMKNNLDSDYIFIRTIKDEYIIKDRKDLVSFALENTYVSFDLLEQYCKLFDEHQFEIKFILSDRDIKLTSDKIDFEVYIQKEDSMVAEEKEEELDYSIDYENMNKVENNMAYDTCSYKGSTRINEDININRTTIINLRLNEIIATLLNISYEDNRISYASSKNYLKKHLYEFEKIGLLVREKKANKRTAYIITNECLTIAQKLKPLLNITPGKKLFMDKKALNNENVYVLFNYVKDDFIKILTRFDDFRFLIRLIDDLDYIGKYTMVDIVKYCIENKYENEFIQIFLGSKGTAGKGAIVRGQDICCANVMKTGIFNSDCKICYERYKINSDNCIEQLLYVRDNIAFKKYKKIVKDKDLQLLVDNPLILKFLVRFGITYYNKNILRALNIIDSEVLMKSTGQYCPYNDEWRASRNEI